MARNDPLRNFRFRLEIDNLAIAGFSEVAIAETMIEAIDYREGTDPPHVRKLSGLTKYGNITLKYGISVGSGSLDLFNWHKAVSDGFVLEQRKRITIVVQDEAGQDKTRLNMLDYPMNGTQTTGPTHKYVYDARYVKLREVLLTYNLPSSLIAKLSPLLSVSISAVG